MALQHLGLAFERLIWYARPWEMDQKHQQEVLAEIANRAAEVRRSAGILPEALAALHERLEAARHSLQLVGWHSNTFTAAVDWRLVTGLGTAGVLEGAGMVLHPLYGFPFLPGSSVKGLVRHYLCFDSQNERDDSRLGRLFGSQDQRGGVIFWDAFPDTLPALEVDITNAHYRDYYMGDLPAPPGDYMSPNPVYFLTVAAGTKFRFTLLAWEGDLLQQAVEATQQAIALLGVGAKTRAGYGSLSVLK
jgi:CRISPR-associated protein Cmr6